MKILNEKLSLHSCYSNTYFYDLDLYSPLIKNSAYYVFIILYQFDSAPIIK